VRRRTHAIGARLRRRSDDAKEEAKAITGEMATIAVFAIGDARHVALNARRGLRRKGMSATGRAAALITELERTAELVERVVAQTRVRLAGGVPDGSTRVVSLHDADARAIAKGRLRKPVEFGYKAQVLARLVVERLDLLAHCEVLVGHGAVGDAGVDHGHPQRLVSEQGRDGLDAHAPVDGLGRERVAKLVGRGAPDAASTSRLRHRPVDP
jgi:hypothetical protein